MKYIFTIAAALMLFAPTIVYAGEQGSYGDSFSQARFVPDISFIFDFSAVSRSLGNEQIKSAGTPGFKNGSNAASAPLSDEGPEFNSKRGFNLNYGEMIIASAVDPYFDLLVNLHISAEGVDFEEGYFSTRKLPFGLQMRAGKFLSSFGRLNEQHAHAWDFVDQPRVYNLFFGAENLNEKGVRVNWLVPAGFYLFAGVEVFQGENEVSFGNEPIKNDATAILIKSNGYPGLYVGYLRTSFDTKDLVLLFGLSNAYGKARINRDFDTGTGSALSGYSNIAGANIYAKYLIDSYRYISLQAEYLYRYMSGRGYEINSNSLTADYSVTKKQSGLYSQMAVRFAERWRCGIRYELINLNETVKDGARESAPSNMAKYSAMIDFNPSEFSRMRLQYSYDRTNYAEENGSQTLKANHEVVLQFNMAVGAHGAHAF